MRSGLPFGFAETVGKFPRFRMQQPAGSSLVPMYIILYVGVQGHFGGLDVVLAKASHECVLLTAPAD